MLIVLYVEILASLKSPVLLEDSNSKKRGIEIKFLCEFLSQLQFMAKHRLISAKPIIQSK